jgi:hypothetical protein
VLLYAVFFSVGDSIADERVRRRRTEIVLMFWQAGLELALVTGGVCALSAHEKTQKLWQNSPSSRKRMLTLSQYNMLNP